MHARIAAYAPYENVRAQDYPHLLVVAGYNDSRVQYWEAAKWVAKLRATRTDANLLLLKTDLGAGHGGMSGRYQGAEGRGAGIRLPAQGPRPGMTTAGAGDAGLPPRKREPS
ncbi:oligopeptidase [Pseudomonas aeruginosa]|nr:oligopeptidase [Pseudomonas aeruginosa]